MFVVAHPDDESFLAAGAIHQNRLAGGTNYIVCATLGEQGKSHLKRPISKAALKKIRKQEVTKAAKFLKVDGLYFLNLNDTKLKEQKKTLSAKTEKLIKQVKPEYLLSFGPDGISGHMDHIITGKITKLLAKKYHIPFAAFAASPTIRNNFDNIKARRKHGKYATHVSHAVPNLKLKVNTQVKQKTLGFHKSQAGPSTLAGSFSKPVKNSFLNYEYFII